jgi:hypothetical protein
VSACERIHQSVQITVAARFKSVAVIVEPSACRRLGLIAA